MQVFRTYVPQSFQNYNHLVFCEQSRLAAAVDPFDASHLLNEAKQQGFKLSQIWITHEHGDHIRHLSQLKELTQAPVFAPKTCQGLFEADFWLNEGDSVNLGQGTARFWSTPGHTPGHGVFYIDGTEPQLICGDTLFNAGVGNTRSGDATILFHSIRALVQKADENTRIFPGHDYILNNLNFALSLQPDLTAARQWLDRCSDESPDSRSTTTLADELLFNPFLRLEDPELVQALSDRGLDVSTPLERFRALRHLRDQW